MISKQFMPGKSLKPGVYTEKGIKTLGFSGICGSNQFVKANYIEMAMNTNLDKEVMKTSCERIFRTVADHVLQHGYGSLEIPEVGVLIINNDMAAVNFQEALKFEVRTILSRTLKERKEKLDSNLTVKNVHQLGNEEKEISIDENAKTWLSNNLNLNVDEIFSAEKPNLHHTEENAFEENELLSNNQDEFMKESLNKKDILFESVSQKSYG